MTVSTVFPGNSVTEPSVEIVSGAVVKSDHIDQLFKEVVAIEQSMLGTLGAARTFVASSTSAVPLTIKAITSQTSNLMEIRSVSNSVLASINTSGKLNLATEGNSNTFGMSFGTTKPISIWPDTGGNLFMFLDATATAGWAILGAGSPNVETARIDTKNGRLLVGAGSNSAAGTFSTLTVSPTGSTASTAGLQFGTEGSGPQNNLYRLTSGIIKTDASLVVGGALTVGPAKIDNTAGGAATTSAIVTVRAQDFEIRRSDVGTRIILSSPNGTRFALKVDNTGQLITEAA